MIYTLKEYAALREVHSNTVLSWIRKNNLPSNHLVKLGKHYMIEIIHGSEQCFRCDLYEKASVEYNRKKGGKKQDAELATELCIKYNLGVRKFFAIHDIK